MPEQYHSERHEDGVSDIEINVKNLENNYLRLNLRFLKLTLDNLTAYVLKT